MKRGREEGDEELKRFEQFCRQFAYSPEKSAKVKNPPPVEEEKTQSKSEDAPFVAPYPNRYREKYSSPCPNCFKNRLQRLNCIIPSLVCPHNQEKRLRMLIIGHNPSDHAWKNGNMYSNPTNRMWKILTGTFCEGSEYKVLENDGARIVGSYRSLNDD